MFSLKVDQVYPKSYPFRTPTFPEKEAGVEHDWMKCESEAGFAQMWVGINTQHHIRNSFWDAHWWCTFLGWDWAGHCTSNATIFIISHICSLYISGAEMDNLDKWKGRNLAQCRYKDWHGSDFSDGVNHHIFADIHRWCTISKWEAQCTIVSLV